MKYFFDPSFPYKMGWIKPKKPFQATAPLKTDLEGDDKSSLCDLAKF